MGFQFGRVLLGYGLIGVIMAPNEKNIQDISLVITGSHDEEIKMAAAHKLSESDGVDIGLDDPRVVVFCERVKDRARLIVNEIFRMAGEEDKRQESENRAKRMAALSSRHAAGTTAEIAALLGVSKAAVRKFKAEGMLDGMLAAHALEKQT